MPGSRGKIIVLVPCERAATRDATYQPANVGLGILKSSFWYRHPNATRNPCSTLSWPIIWKSTSTSWTPDEDAALMLDLNKVHDRLNQEERIGPAARLGATEDACVLRGPGAGFVTDGPFTESKEQLLGFYVIDCADRDAAIAAARDLRRVNPAPSTKFVRFGFISRAWRFRRTRRAEPVSHPYG